MGYFKMIPDWSVRKKWAENEKPLSKPIIR